MSEEPPTEGAFHRSERRRRRRLALGIALALLVPAGWVAARETQTQLLRREARLSPPQRAQLAALLDRREAVAREAVARWNQAAHRDALAQAAPGEAPCPLAVEPPAQFSAGAYVKYATHDEKFGTWSLCLLRPGAAPEACGRTYQPTPLLTRLRALLAEDDAHTWDLEEAQVPPAAEPPAAVVVVEQEVLPVVQAVGTGKASFVPGTVAGRGWLYDPTQGRMVCSGKVSVRNSKSVDVEYNHFGEGDSPEQGLGEVRAAIERDLEVVLRFALPRALRALPTGPVPAAP